jgi:hypothetical protein
MTACSRIPHGLLQLALQFHRQRPGLGPGRAVHRRRIVRVDAQRIAGGGQRRCPSGAEAASVSDASCGDARQKVK